MRAKEVAQRARLDALASLPIAAGVDVEELGPEEEGRGLSAQPGWVRTTRLIARYVHSCRHEERSFA